MDWTGKFGAIARAAAALPACLVDGEVVALDEKGVPTFTGLQAAISKRETGELVFVVFDLLFLESSDLRKLPLATRRTLLEKLIDIRPSPRIRYVERVALSGEVALREAYRKGWEGIVSKRIDARYQSGRSDTWVKLKCRGENDVMIG